MLLEGPERTIEGNPVLVLMTNHQCINVSWQNMLHSCRVNPGEIGSVQTEPFRNRT